MSDDRGPRTPSQMIPRDPRAAIVVPIRYRYPSIIDFVETQSMNISRSGMFVMTDEPLPLGTVLDFECVLSDGFCLLKGKAQVARVSAQDPKGLGLRFEQLDESSRKLIQRIVEVNTTEGKRPTVAMDFVIAEATSGGRPNPLASAEPEPVIWRDQDVAIELSPKTVGYFVYNPLLNIRLGGCVIPSDRDVPLGTVFAVTIRTPGGESLFSGRGKVVAKHERRLGLRLSDGDKTALSALQAEVTKLVAANK